MDKFLVTQFQKLQEISVSKNLHSSILGSISVRKYRKYLLVATTLVSLNFIFSLYHTYSGIIETGSASVINAVTNTFDPSFDSLIDSFQTLMNFLPVQAIFLSLVNLIILFFMISLLSTAAKLSDGLSA